MTNIEEIILEEKKEPVCINCAHFYQHYVKVEDNRAYFKKKIIALDEGHCTYPRIKTRKASNTCEYFQHKKKEE